MISRFAIDHIASGQAFFTGAVCLVLAACLPGWKKRRAGRAARNALISLGVLFVLVSATPMPVWWGALLVLASIAWLVVEASSKKRPSRIMVGSRTIFAGLWIAAMLVELPYHLMPTIPSLGDPTFGIIADSVTAGTGGNEPGTWPVVFADRYHVKVHDHSKAGATVATALKQAALVTADEHLVLLEIGGNDLLGGTTTEAFEAGLSRLLETLKRPGRVVVMLELPLPPSYNAFGQIQRGLARRTGTILVPKRVLLGLLLQEGSTIDSIHLTPEGHRRMANRVWTILKSAFDREK